MTLKKKSKITSKLVEAFNYEFVVVPGNLSILKTSVLTGSRNIWLIKKHNVDQLQIERAIKTKYLPEVLSLEEIKAILDNTHNLKHKTLLSLIYSAGLRIGEAINLRISDIDSRRKLISVKMVKGNKDRYTLLSPRFLNLLREYYKVYKPESYLFEGRVGGP